MAELREAGHRLWLATFLDYGEEGGYRPLGDSRPLLSLFEGVVGGVGANSSVPVRGIPATLAGVVRAFAQEVGPGMPVVLSLNGPPISAQTGGAFCEAEICPSDFRGMFGQTEAWLEAAVESLSPQQWVGLGVALFEGSQFDLRDPYEDFGPFRLNRVGETGYNNPVLNSYRSR